MQSLSETTAFSIGVLIVAPVVLWLFLKLKKAAAEKRRVSSLLERERAIIAAAPEGLFVWDLVTGREFCSRRLAVLLGLEAGTKATFEDVAHRFGKLDPVVEALRRDGTPFEISLPWRNGMLGVKGTRTGGADGRPLSDLLWFHEEAAGTEQKETGDTPLHGLLDALPWPVWIRDKTLETVFTNRACRNAGLKPPDGLARRAREKGTAQSEVHLFGSGKARLMEITEAPMPGGRGGLGFAQDRSDREALEGEFSRHVHARDRVLENLATAIAIFDNEGKIVFSNPAYEKLWDFDASWLATAPALNEILDRLRKKRKLPEVADFSAYKSEQMALIGSLGAPRDTLMHLPDGRTLRCFLSPHDTGGLVMAFEDVTGRLALERSYNALIAVQKETLDHLYEGVAVFGGDGRLKLFNPTFAKLWSLDEGFLGGAPHLSDFIEAVRPLLWEERKDGEDWPSHKDKIVSRLIGREPGTGKLIRLDGVILNYANVPLPDGAVLLSYLDVTDSARVEKALRDRAEAMAEANRLKSEFIANVSFEVRTPLNTVIGFANILADEHFGPLNRRQKEYSRGILETSEGLMSIIEDILDLATIEAGQMSLNADAVDLHAMLASMISLIRERARRKSLHLEFDCPPDIGWLVADEKRLKQVLFNLLSNAVSFTPERGTVGLRAERDAAWVRFTVSDTGPGVPKAEREQIFDAFSRGSVPREGQGAGLGLSLVKRFVELHGGRVELSSAPGRGTSVTCRLPVKNNETA